MNDVETRLRLSLLDRAADIPGGTELLAPVTARSNRLAVRRRAFLGVAAAAVVAAVAVPVGVSATGEEPPQTVTAAGGAVTLEQRPISTVTFPYRLTNPPAGYRVTRIDTGPFTQDMTLENGKQYLSVAVQGRADPEDDPPISDQAPLDTFQPTTVRGRPAKFRWQTTHPENLSLYWQQKPGFWLVVRGGDFSRAALTRFAGGVVAGTTTAPTPFTVGAVPKGYSLGESYLDSQRLCAGRCAEYATPRDVVIELAFASKQPTGERIVVDGRAAWLRNRNGVWQISVKLPARLNYLAVKAPSGENFDRATFLRMVASITVRPGLETMGG